MAPESSPRRVRVALAALTVLVTALAGCAGQPGEQVVNEPQAAGDPAVAATDERYSESTPGADPTTPAAAAKTGKTGEPGSKPNKPAETAEPDPGGADEPNQPATTNPAPRQEPPPAVKRGTTRPPITTGPPQPGRENSATTRPPVTTGPPQPPATTAPPPVTTGPPQPPATTAPPPATTAPPGLDFGPDECSEGNGLPLHDGFQNGGRCVDTEMGEVAGAADNPSLLITEAPERVGVNQPFTIRVSTRNLVRDRFLPAGQGGYYVDMSILTAQGLVRGHFHTACRVLTSTEVAPEPAPAPAFFVATEDRQGGSEPDVIEIRVPGLPQAGTFQCSAWAGDASHRIPMMQRANQIPALDSVRVEVG
ncbi:Pecanex-like protein 1 [Phytohabitans sp. ZYX-F-186]|uniref:Pecanex-like protein 1 n=1 Tax=Phytohabitans maris TaxID=3071409 RepID=A0ABU0ZH22_9ACTN|nr:Pecanex-like protein 1 [Phytohabitans sp. ZYX-F-186]MDQ7906361.1 Pecanex-like protein 1 [Phytohabitans sp. ZYX-F-186]